MSSLKLLLVLCLTSQLRLHLSPAEWAAILCGVGGAEDLEELDVTMELTDVSSVYYIERSGTNIVQPHHDHNILSGYIPPCIYIYACGSH